MGQSIESALCESESTLRSLLENLPDFVLMVDRNAVIQFANRDAPAKERGSDSGRVRIRLRHSGTREACQLALHEAFVTGQPQTVEG